MLVSTHRRAAASWPRGWPTPSRWHPATSGGAVRDATGGEGADLVVNATGFPGTFAQAEAMVRDGGTIVEVGAFVDMGGETFNPASICGRSLALLGVGGEDLATYEGTLALLDRHRDSIPFGDMVSHRFDVIDAPGGDGDRAWTPTHPPRC